MSAGASGSGNGNTVTLQVAANTGAARAGTATIAGQTFTVNQSAATGGTTISVLALGVQFGGSVAATSHGQPLPTDQQRGQRLPGPKRRGCKCVGAAEHRS